MQIRTSHFKEIFIVKLLNVPENAWKQRFDLMLCGAVTIICNFLFWFFHFNTGFEKRCILGCNSVEELVLSFNGALLDVWRLLS